MHLQLQKGYVYSSRRQINIDNIIIVSIGSIESVFPFKLADKTLVNFVIPHDRLFNDVMSASWKDCH